MRCCSHGDLSLFILWLQADPSCEVLWRWWSCLAHLPSEQSWSAVQQRAATLSWALELVFAWCCISQPQGDHRSMLEGRAAAACSQSKGWTGFSGVLIDYSLGANPAWGAQSLLSDHTVVFSQLMYLFLPFGCNVIKKTIPLQYYRIVLEY